MWEPVTNKFQKRPKDQKYTTKLLVNDSPEILSYFVAGKSPESCETGAGLPSIIGLSS